MSDRSRRLLLSLLAGVIAVVAALVILAIVLAILGVDPFKAVGALFNFGETPRAQSNQIRAWINRSIPLFLAGLAVSVGFRMNLFNIGVDGQYRIAAFAAALFAGQAWFPGPLNVLLTLVVAMVAGGIWAGIAAYLKVKRGISEVISTIMLNAIATGVVQWLLLKVAVKQQGSNTISTQPIPESSQLGGLALIPGATNKVYCYGVRT